MNPIIEKNMNHKRIAVIGAGPAGLVAAKYLLEEGFHPVLLEQSDSLGGQWNANAPHSGVWPSMRANTSRVTTRFSDLEHLDGVPMFPATQQIRDYLHRYAAHFSLEPNVRLNTCVSEIAFVGSKWIVTSSQRGEPGVSEIYSHVVIASGRHNKPQVPNIKGLDLFKGAGGVTHTFHYRGNKPFTGQRVLVVGNSISGLEICSDLALDPGNHVISVCRKPRYIFSKTLSGRPTDCVAFNRFASLAFRALPLPQAAEGLKQLLLQHCGNPAQYGGLMPSANILEAGITQCQNYLPLVAEGKIIIKGAAAEFTEDAVIFEDGTREALDAVILATGYDLNLPFLSADLRRRLDVDDTHLDLYQHTFHPELPGLACIGLYSQIGPYFPTVELQARWVAMTFSGRRPLPMRETMLAGIAAHRKWKRRFKEVVVHDMVLLFSQAAGVAPDLVKRPELAKALLFGPLSPVQFRMDGHDKLPDAAARFAEAVAEFGCVTNLQFETHELKGLEMLAANLKEEKWLTELLEKVR
jgi:hypothetical protein